MITIFMYHAIHMVLQGTKKTCKNILHFSTRELSDTWTRDSQIKWFQPV